MNSNFFEEQKQYSSMVFVVLSLFSVTMIGVLSDAGPRCSFLADVDHNCKDDPSNCVGEKDGNKELTLHLGSLLLHCTR